MRIIFDTKNLLEYLTMEDATDIENASFDFINPKSSNHIVDVENIQDVNLFDKTTNEMKKYKLVFPIGTIFTTLYNLSVLGIEDLKSVLFAVKNKPIDTLKSSELLTLYFLKTMGSEKLYLDLGKANLLNDVYGFNVDSFRDLRFYEKLFPKDFLSLKKEDKLLLLKIRNPSFPIEKHIQTNKGNYISNFICIITYYLRSFCVSYLYYLVKSTSFQNEKLGIDDVNKLFIKMIEEEKEPQVKKTRLRSDKYSIEDKIRIALKEAPSHIYENFNFNNEEEFIRPESSCPYTYNAVIDMYKNLYATLLYTVDFNFPNSYDPESIDLNSSPGEKTIHHFLEKSYESINILFYIYAHFNIKLKLVKKNSCLPIVYSFSDKDQNELNLCAGRASFFTSHFKSYSDDDIDDTDDSNEIYGLEWELIENLINRYYETNTGEYSNIFNTRPELSPKSQDSDSNNQNNYVSLYIDFLLQFFLNLFITGEPCENLSQNIYEFYFKNFENFCLIRSNESMSSIFPNENLVSIECNRLKNLLCCAFYGYVCYEKNGAIHKCQDKGCPCICLSLNNQAADCDFHEYIENVLTQNLKNNYSDMRKRYTDDHKSDPTNSFNKKNKALIKMINDKLLKMSSCDITKINKNELKKITTVLKTIFKNIYTFELIKDYQNFIVNHLEIFSFQKYFQKTYVSFKKLTYTKQGISPLNIIKNKLDLLERCISDNHNGFFEMDKENLTDKECKDIKNLYKLTSCNNFQDVDLEPYNLEDYIRLIQKAKYYFIKIIVYYKESSTTDTICKIPNMNIIFLNYGQKEEHDQKKEHDQKEYNDCINWIKENKYNGMMIVISELSKLEQHFISLSNHNVNES